jgi:hypothetical protein
VHSMHMFPFGLLGGPIVLEDFVGNLLRSKPGSTVEVHSILAHLLVETSYSLCYQFSRPLSESEEHKVMILHLSTPSEVGLT